MAATKAKSATKRAIKTTRVSKSTRVTKSVRVTNSTQSGKAAKPKLHKPRVSASLLEDVAIASRVLAQHQVLDAFGHVSARSDRNPDHFVMTRSLAPELATPADMMEFDSDSEAVGGDSRKPFEIGRAHV